MTNDIRKAKAVRYFMTERANMGCGEDETDQLTVIADFINEPISAVNADGNTTPYDFFSVAEPTPAAPLPASVPTPPPSPTALTPRLLVAKLQKRENEATSALFIMKGTIFTSRNLVPKLARFEKKMSIKIG